MSITNTLPKELVNQALAGNVQAQFELAELYMQSDDENDNELAEEWALKAAENGHISAMYWIGEGYTVYAKEVAEDDPEEAKTYFNHAFYWLSKASEHDHAASILELAWYYRRGDIIEKDVPKSIALVKKSAELGYLQAMRDLSAIYEHGLGIDIDEAQASFWLEKAQKSEDETH